MNKTRFKNQKLLINSKAINSLAIFAFNSKNKFFITHTAIGHFKCICPTS